MKILLITILALSISACTQKKNITSTTNDINTNSKNTSADKESVEEVEVMDAANFDNECFRGRAVTKEVNGQKATMVKAVGLFMFTFENTRWQPCSVPAEFQMEGLEVIVSGQVLEIKPNERRAGTPFNITNLEKVN